METELLALPRKTWESWTSRRTTADHLPTATGLAPPRQRFLAWQTVPRCLLKEGKTRPFPVRFAPISTLGQEVCRLQRATGTAQLVAKKRSTFCFDTQGLNPIRLYYALIPKIHKKTVSCGLLEDVLPLLLQIVLREAPEVFIRINYPNWKP